MEQSDAHPLRTTFEWLVLLVLVCPSAADIQESILTAKDTDTSIQFICVSLQGDTILAMDFMEGGNLWDALTMLDKKGDPIYQWNGRGKRVAHDIALGMHFLHDLRQGLMNSITLPQQHLI